MVNLSGSQNQKIDFGPGLPLAPNTEFGVRKNFIPTSGTSGAPVPITMPVPGSQFQSPVQSQQDEAIKKSQLLQQVNNPKFAAPILTQGSEAQGQTQPTNINEQLTQQANQTPPPIGMNRVIQHKGDKIVSPSGLITTAKEDVTLGQSLVTGATAAALIATAFSLASSAAMTSVSISKGLFGKGSAVGLAKYISHSVFQSTREDIRATEKSYDDVIAAVQVGAISETDAFNAISLLENTLDKTEQTMKTASSNVIANWFSGGKDALTDIAQVRMNLIAKRTLLANTIVSQRVMGANK